MGAAATFPEPSKASSEAKPRDGIPRRILGRTKESVTILGLGCAYIGNNLNEAQTRAIIEAALEGGVRYFDTSRDYKQSEVRLGPVLAPLRDKTFLVTKINCTDAKGAEEEFTQSLRLLKTDHVDLLLQHCIGAMIHEPADVTTIVGRGGSLEFLRKAKKQGLTRFIGMSVHAPYALALQLFLESDEWDVIMPFVNYVSQAQQIGKVSEQEFLAVARRRNLGIAAMKVLGGYPGKLAEDYDRAFRYALSVRGVACAVIGVRTVAEIKRAMRAATEFRPLTDAEMKETIRMGQEMVRAHSPEVVALDRHRKRDLGSADRV
jgi:predicted aldo/keto reductase-like oxidoreductase